MSLSNFNFGGYSEVKENGTIYQKLFLLYHEVKPLTENGTYCDKVCELEVAKEGANLMFTNCSESTMHAPHVAKNLPSSSSSQRWSHRL